MTGSDWFARGLGLLALLLSVAALAWGEIVDRRVARRRLGCGPGALAAVFDREADRARPATGPVPNAAASQLHAGDGQARLRTRTIYDARGRVRSIRPLGAAEAPAERSPDPGHVSYVDPCDDPYPILVPTTPAQWAAVVALILVTVAAIVVAARQDRGVPPLAEPLAELRGSR